MAALIRVVAEYARETAFPLSEMLGSSVKIKESHEAARRCCASTAATG